MEGHKAVLCAYKPSIDTVSCHSFFSFISLFIAQILTELALVRITGDYLKP